MTAATQAPAEQTPAAPVSPAARSRKRTLTIGVALATAAALGALLQLPYYSYLLQLIAVYGLLALSLNLLFGYAGQVSLGHAVFYAVGAYGSGILEDRLGWSAFLAWPAAIALAALLAVVVGLPVLRLRGHLLAMGTLALGLVAYQVLIAERELTGGFDGTFVNPQTALAPIPLAVLPHLTVLALVAAFVAMEALGRSNVGAALRMVRTDEEVAASLGVNVARYKLGAFVASAALAALAGCFYIHALRIVTPGVFGLDTSINILLIVVIGGVGSNWGALVGATLFVVLPELLADFAAYSALLYGAAVLLLLLFAPNGVAGVARNVAGRVRARRTHADAPGAPAAGQATPTSSQQRGGAKRAGSQ